MNQSQPPSRSRRMPRGSFFYERIVPLILLLISALFALVLIAALAAVLGGLYLSP